MRRFLLFSLLTLLAASSYAQPFGSWSVFDSSEHSYYEIPHHASLNPSSGLTIEGWIFVDSSSGCDSLIGKGWTESYWVGVCGGTLRSYVSGSSTILDGGDLLNGKWNHIAVTYDGAHQSHYVNGVQILSHPQTKSLNTANTKPVRIGSDFDWTRTPNASINRIRLWSVARTQQQIRDNINEPLDSPQSGLVAIWNNGQDVLGNHDGVAHGTIIGWTFPVATSCAPSGTNYLCLQDNRFAVTVEWEDFAHNTGDGFVVPGVSSADSGLFYFFNPSNWEMLIKVLDGCPVNNKFWVFFAATTNVGFRLEVLDVQAGVNKVYFNYLGESANAVTDTGAFATCP